jgi:class 3 adenylate cyclase
MAEQVRRKLATILAADVVGYSRLTGADEEGTLKTLKTYREIIDPLVARHEGRIFGTAGDSVIAEFGSAVEAVRCAIAIQEELKVRNAELSENRRMLFRICWTGRGPSRARRGEPEIFRGQNPIVNEFLIARYPLRRVCHFAMLVARP